MAQYNLIAGSPASVFATDAGNAIPNVVGILNVLGGTNIGTTGAGNTVTINLDGTITLATVEATTFDTNVAAAGVTLAGTSLLADGTDANIDINITAKGTGQVIIDDLQLTAPLTVPYGGTGVNTLTDHGLMLGSGVGTVTSLAEATDGQIPIGSTGNDPVLATLTAGAGVVIGNAAGAITISSPGAGLPWVEVVGIAQAMAVDTGYILNNAALVTATLPAAAVVGETIAVVGKGAGGWLIAQNAGQTIHFLGADTTAGVGGSLSSTTRYDCVELVCITANTDFCVRSSMGNITIV